MLQPTDGILDSFDFDVVGEAFVVDSSREIREMERPGLETENNLGYWSTIKAASVLRMFRDALPANVFSEGVRILLNDSLCNSITTDNFSGALQSAYDEGYHESLDIASIIYSWSKTASYPSITVEKTPSTITINQSQEMELFLIPINYIAQNNYPSNSLPKYDLPSTSADIWMQDHFIEIYNNETAPKQWLDGSIVIFNNLRSGFYRVNYDENSWRSIIDEFIRNHRVFHYLDRVMVLDDLLDFWRNDLIEGLHYLDLLTYMTNEDEMWPWLKAASGFDFLYNMLDDTPALDDLLDFIRNIIKDSYATIKDSDVDQRFKNIIINWACKAELPECVNDANENLETLMTVNIKALNVIELCNIARNASQINLGRFFHKLTTSHDEDQRKFIIEGLTCSNDEEFHNFVLSMTRDSNWSDDENFLVFSAFIENSKFGADSVMKHLLENGVSNDST